MTREELGQRGSEKGGILGWAEGIPGVGEQGTEDQAEI